jgi:hypothetical protein
MIDYAQCILAGFPGSTQEDFILEDTGNGIEITYWNELKGAKPSLEYLAQFELGVVKKQSLADIKDIRRQGLDKSAISSGILAIYNTNYEAAILFLEGKRSEVMKTGMTAETYLTGFGTKLQMTALQFANYIIAENYRVGPNVYDIEKRYLALAYGGDIPNGIYPISVLPSKAAVLKAVADFKTFCEV